MSEVRINLPIFEGPLDLLLYLIRRDELDIWDIPIHKITEEYLGYVETLQTLDLDLAGDFVVMAATLTEIKSRMLLPTLLQPEGEEAGDPRQALVERLLEYERYRQAAERIAGLNLLGRDTFERVQSAVEDPEAGRPLPDVGLWELVEALRSVMDRARLRGHIHHVDVERFSVVERIHWLHDRIHSHGPVGFLELFLSLPTRMDIVLTFLAMLEMIKRGLLVLLPAGERNWVIAPRPDDEGGEGEVLALPEEGEIEGG